MWFLIACAWVMFEAGLGDLFHFIFDRLPITLFIMYEIYA